MGHRRLSTESTTKPPASKDPHRLHRVTVSRETLELVATEFGLPSTAPGQIAAVLAALAEEPDPHTTVSDPDRALDVHVRDSLSALAVPAVRRATRIADLGAGAGFPGLPLAIALPGAQVDLIESASRKTAVVERLAAAAGLGNARAVHARAEEWASADGSASYDVVTARAVAPLNVLVEYAAPLLELGGTFVAWKGSLDPDELSAGTSAASQVGLRPLELLAVAPYEDARDLHLHLYSKVADTPARFPRRPGVATKRPLVPRN